MCSAGSAGCNLTLQVHNGYEGAHVTGEGKLQGVQGRNRHLAKGIGKALKTAYSAKKNDRGVQEWLCLGGAGGVLRFGMNFFFLFAKTLGIF